MGLENTSPIVFESRVSRDRAFSPGLYDGSAADRHDSLEIFDLIRDVSDPEHPLTLEQLNVVNPLDINVVDCGCYTSVFVYFTPTIPHCSMATLIGLCIMVKLVTCLPPTFKCSVYVKKDTHQSEPAINRQLNDKERVAAAMENQHLLGVVKQCLLGGRS